MYPKRMHISPPPRPREEGRRRLRALGGHPRDSLIRVGGTVSPRGRRWPPVFLWTSVHPEMGGTHVSRGGGSTWRWVPTVFLWTRVHPEMGAAHGSRGRGWMSARAWARGSAAANTTAPDQGRWQVTVTAAPVIMQLQGRPCFRQLHVGSELHCWGISSQLLAPGSGGQLGSGGGPGGGEGGPPLRVLQ
jgi:hypothetical protein